MSARDLLFELQTEELPPRTLSSLSSALTEGLVKGLDAAGIAHGAARGFATPRRLAVLVAACAEAAPDRNVERRGPPVSHAFDAAGAPTQAALAFARNCGVEVAQLERLVTEKGAWLVFRGIERGTATATLFPGPDRAGHRRTAHCAAHAMGVAQHRVRAAGARRRAPARR